MAWIEHLTTGTHDWPTGVEAFRVWIQAPGGNGHSHNDSVSRGFAGGGGGSRHPIVFKRHAQYTTTFDPTTRQVSFSQDGVSDVVAYPGGHATAFVQGQGGEAPDDSWGLKQGNYGGDGGHGGGGGAGFGDEGQEPSLGDGSDGQSMPAGLAGGSGGKGMGSRGGNGGGDGEDGETPPGYGGGGGAPGGEKTTEPTAPAGAPGDGAPGRVLLEPDPVMGQHPCCCVPIVCNAGTLEIPSEITLNLSFVPDADFTHSPPDDAFEFDNLSRFAEGCAEDCNNSPIDPQEGLMCPADPHSIDNSILTSLSGGIPMVVNSVEKVDNCCVVQYCAKDVDVVPCIVSGFPAEPMTLLTIRGSAPVTTRTYQQPETTAPCGVGGTYHAEVNMSLEAGELVMRPLLTVTICPNGDYEIDFTCQVWMLMYDSRDDDGVPAYTMRCQIKESLTLTASGSGTLTPPLSWDQIKALAPAADDPTTGSGSVDNLWEDTVFEICGTRQIKVDGVGGCLLVPPDTWSFDATGYSYGDNAAGATRHFGWESFSITISDAV